MASAQSIRRGQALSVCHLCETDTNIQYQCLDCLLLMCKKCKDKIHVKIKNSERHKIVDIKDIENESEIDFTNLKCEDHSAFCCLFCKSCDQLVCPTCVAKGHKSHDLIEISEAYQQKLDGMKEIQESNNEILSQLKSIKGNLEQLKSFQRDKMAIEENKMEDHRKALKRVVDIQIDKLIKEIKLSKEEVLEAFIKDIKAIKQVAMMAQAKGEELTELTSTNDANKLFQETSKMKKIQEINIPQTPSNLMSTPKFVPKDINLSDIGELQRESNAASGCNQISLKIKEQYQSELAGISYTCLCTDGSQWIANSKDDTVQRVRPDKKKLKVLSKINTRIGGMASTESGHLLISTKGTSLQQISCKSDQISDTQYKVAPLIATAIHFIQEGKVIVGGGDNERVTVFVIATDGRHERTYEHDNHGQSLFTYPLHITSTKNGRIHVVDCHPNHDRGRLLVLSKGGNLINIYSGHPGANKVTPFCPVGIACTPGDNVFIVDYQINYLHLLDNTGHLLTVYDTKEAGILDLHALAFTTSGSVWIGCAKRVNSEAKNAKLYHVTLSAC